MSRRVMIGPRGLRAPPRVRKELKKGPPQGLETEKLNTIPLFLKNIINKGGLLTAQRVNTGFALFLSFVIFSLIDNFSLIKHSSPLNFVIFFLELNPRIIGSHMTRRCRWRVWLSPCPTLPSSSVIPTTMSASCQDHLVSPSCLLGKLLFKPKD